MSALHPPIRPEYERDLPPFDVPAIVVEHPKNPEFGDYSTNVAMQSARLAKMAPIKIAEALVASVPTRRPIRFQRVAGANHFMNDGPVEPLLAALEACIPARRPWLASRLPQWLRPAWLRLGPWETHARA